MTIHRSLTLLTDFGLSDVYVAVIKGVIAQIDPTLNVIDLTHEVPPQNLAAAQFHLMNAYPYFPLETVHVAIVDPGVGSQRRSIAIQLTNGFLVGPDNGIFSGVLSQHPLVAAIELTNSAFWRTAAPSATFHGRDIFAAVGAHLARGVPLSQLGNAIDPRSLVQLPLPAPARTANQITGCVQHVDRFGNLITNIPQREVDGKRWSVVLPQQTIPASTTYADRLSGELVALVGSHGWVEVALNGGSAHARLQLTWGDLIHIELNEPATAALS
jgi:hypothetical protein